MARKLNTVKYPWMLAGPRPTCINPGCNELCVHSGNRWRAVCWRCHEEGYGKKGITLKPGVTRFKTGECTNQDGHLGFSCPTDYVKAPHAKGVTELEHMDKNYFNNVPSNVEELCPTCHKIKGMRDGDFSSGKKYKIAA